MLKKLHLLFVLCFFLQELSGQEKPKDVAFQKNNFPGQEEEFKEAVQNLKKGEQFVFNATSEGYRKAIPFLQAAHDFNPNNSYLNYQLGLAYLNSGKKYKCGPFFLKAYELNEQVSPDILLFVGMGYHLESDWDKAINYYRKFLDSSKDKTVAPLVYKKIEECENGIDLSMNQTRVWLDNLGEEINSVYSDHSPVVTADERLLYFTSKREGSTGDLKDEMMEYYEDIYYSEKPLGEENWSPAKNIGEPINSKKHDATVGISPDGEKLLVYRSKKKIGGDFYYTTKDNNGIWSEPQAFSTKINSEKHEPDASISFDGKKLFFSSDRENGQGMHDIYVSEWNEELQDWGEPENLGLNINTEFDERGPFIHPDNRTLYFSSNGHNSIGGLDVFYSKLEDGVWSRPMNLGIPVNTPDDDVYFVVTGSGRYAYYSSYKDDGFGELDIYLVTLLGEEKVPLAMLDYQSIDVSTLSVFEDGTLTRSLIKGDLTNVEGKAVDAEINFYFKNGDLAFTAKPDEDGKFRVGLNFGEEYRVIVQKEGYETYDKFFKMPEKDQGAIFQKNIQLNKPKVVGDVITFKDILFDFDKSDLRAEALKELDRIVDYLKEHPDVKMLVAGHTDQRGSDSYNKRLSERRAKSAYQYLTKNGISKKRLKYKGYGLEKPLVTMAEINKMATEDQKEAAFQKNRRTEFIITE